MDRMKKHQIKVSCKSGNLQKIRKFVSGIAKEVGFNEVEIDKIELAVDEASANVVKHAYIDKKDKNILVEVKIFSDKFTVLVKDTGKGFNPEEIELPDMNEYLKNYKVGGLGIHLMKTLMDDVKFDIRPGISNQVKLVKYFDKENAEKQ